MMIRRISRRKVLYGLAGAAAFGSAFPAPAVWAQSNMHKLKAALPAVLDSVIFHIAVVKGMFAAERLEVELIPSPGGVATMSGVAANEFQIGLATVTAMIFGKVEGLNFQIVVPTSFVGTAPPDDIGGLLIRKGSGMMNGAKLVGKRAGTPVLNNVPALALRTWIDQTGGDSSKVQLIEVPPAQMADALMGNRVDALMVIDPFFTAALDANPDKIEVAAYPMSQAMPGTIVGAAMAAQEFCAKNRDIMHAFSRASNKAMDWEIEHKGTPELAQVVSDFTKLRQDRVRNLRLWPKLQKTVDVKVIDRVSQSMVKYGLIKSAPDSASLIFETARG